MPTLDASALSEDVDGLDRLKAALARHRAGKRSRNRFARTKALSERLDATAERAAALMECDDLVPTPPVV